jgi:hypothetical protein
MPAPEVALYSTAVLAVVGLSVLRVIRDASSTMAPLGGDGEPQS